MLKLTRAPRGVRNFLTIAMRGIATTISVPYLPPIHFIVSLGVFHRLSCLFEAFITKQTVDNTDSKRTEFLDVEKSEMGDY